MRCVLPLSLFLLALPAVAVRGQNLVPNGSFEDYTSLPDEQGDFGKVKYWNNLNGQDNFPAGTPDYLHTEAKGDAGLPDSYFGRVMPYEGKAVAGLLTYGDWIDNFGEYLSTRLIMPMLPGHRYRVSYRVSNGTGHYYGCMASDGLGFHFSTRRVYQEQHERPPVEAQLEEQEIHFTTGWREVQYWYTPDSAYEYLTFGCFREDSRIRKKKVVDEGTGGAYFFIDDIRVVPEDNVFRWPESAPEKVECRSSLRFAPRAGLCLAPGDRVVRKREEEVGS